VSHYKIDILLLLL